MPDTTGRLLIVDDLENNLQLLGQLLSTEGYELAFALDGETALERAIASPPDLVLLDLFLPGKSGFEVVQSFRQHPSLAGIPVIFLTSANDSETATKAFAAGAVDFVSKPFDHRELLARVRTHMALKNTRDRLGKLVEERNRLMDVLAHDLRNSLSSLKLSTYLLGSGKITDPNKRTELNETVTSSLQMMESLIQSHLEAAAEAQRSTQLRLRTFDLKRFLDDVVSTQRLRASEKEITLTIALPSEEAPLSVHADPLGTRQVLENFLSNAIKFSPPDSSVQLAVVQAASSVILRIQDEGPGLTEADQQGLWAPFARLSAQPTGGESSTGLGLSIVKEIAEKMQCRVGCESEPGKGACFWIELPSP